MLALVDHTQCARPETPGQHAAPLFLGVEQHRKVGLDHSSDVRGRIAAIGEPDVENDDVQTALGAQQRGNRRGREGLSDLRAQLEENRQDSAQNRRMIVDNTEPQPLAHNGILPFATFLVVAAERP